MRQNLEKNWKEQRTLLLEVTALGSFSLIDRSWRQKIAKGVFDLNILSIKMIDLTLKEYSVWQQQKHVLLKLIRIFFHTDGKKGPLNPLQKMKI